ncbi:hypothetical protein EYZ11_008049 [Aspergillus tanneri]|uniref:N-terminal acetyltransferase n=1 Tax=Aspergillus tanneri TaxID=1220188 RepID=A0A4S3JBV3_9EURO|nr:N-terminal acetyltransferase [Aspergillus tanneri]KAA8648744.1 N-terminal acetyltransferase [Aspergillus tanneri]THC92485.1 hypothetical protein EYZ11_008049 [Aspergillus tanneri]
MAPTYTPDQLERYLQRIQYADSALVAGTTRLEHVQSSIKHDPLATLTELQRRHLATIPWGNSALHYSQHLSISVNPSSIFEKLVGRRLDGYCMENTNLIYVVLRSLGYTVYATGGRVCEAANGVNKHPGQERFSAIGHMILIVTIAGQKYMVDVGFGSNCPTSPLPLIEGATAVCIAPSEMRLIRDTLYEFVDKTQKVWVYQIRYNPDSDWIPHYSFSEVEFLPQDYVMMNFFTSKQPRSWFTQTVVCSRVILDEMSCEPRGVYVLAGKEVKRRLRGKAEVVETLESDDDRVRALGKWFDMHFHDYEVDGIQGLVSQFK